jgi:S1-C subfamily serine protease
MTDNSERLKALQNSEKQSTRPTNQPESSNSFFNNTENLEGLQPGEVPRQQVRSTPTSNNSNAPNNATGSTSPPGNLGVTDSSKRDWRTWGLWGGIGAAVVVGIVITVLVGISFVNPDATNMDSNQSSEAIPMLDSEPDVTVNQGPPTDIPSLAANITKSTVLIECIDGFGSGFVFDAEPLTGLAGSEIIVTNQHVIEGCEGANELTVSTATSMSKGSVVAYDVSQDLAIIEAPALTANPLSIGLTPVIGQWAMAVGNPDGITDTVTVGNITNVKLDEGFILSDVLLGPGNSGGPLVDNQGHVLGVNTAVLIAAEGFSFSVPIENLCDQLLKCK